MKMMDLFPDERPREKLLCQGGTALSTPELLAVLLRTGTKTENVVDVARKLLAAADGSLARLSSMSMEQMTAVKGVGESKAVAVAAAFELGRRFASEKSVLTKTSITSASMIFSLMIPLLKGLAYEECWIVLLNRAHYVIGKEVVSKGGSTSTVIDVKKIIRRTLEYKAEAVILVHNHPSGNPRPGQCDIRETEALRNALNQVDVSLLDHVVVSDDCYFSFADDQVCFVTSK